MKQISVKISDVLYNELQKWLAYNPGHNQSAVVATALEKYIHEPQLLKPVGKISKEEVEASFQKMMQEHHDTIKKLTLARLHFCMVGHQKLLALWRFSWLKLTPLSMEINELAHWLQPFSWI